MLPATKAAKFKPQKREQEPSFQTQHSWRSQTAFVHQGRVQCFQRPTDQTFFPQHCGSAISVTQLQHLPSSLHHVTCCEAFHGNTTHTVSPSAPKALLQSAATPSTHKPPPPLQVRWTAARILYLCGFFVEEGQFCWLLLGLTLAASVYREEPAETLVRCAQEYGFVVPLVVWQGSSFS